MDIKFIVNLSSRAWSLPVLASLHSGVPGRQAPLLVATGAGRTAFGQSMERLIDIGVVERNPGHGHPLRPEFRLTKLGEPIAALAFELQTIAGPQQDLLRRSWTLPTLCALGKYHHFNELKRALKVTDRALSKALKELEEHQWVQRSVDESARPPRSIYTAIGPGAAISAAVYSP